VTTAFLDSFEYTCSCIEVIESGLATSVQDGTPRVKGDGIPYGGPFDTIAARAANVLAGNDERAEVLECTMMSVFIHLDPGCEMSLKLLLLATRGPALLFSEKTVIGTLASRFTLALTLSTVFPRLPRLPRHRRRWVRHQHRRRDTAELVTAGRACGRPA
jgi:hypothetical protein